MLKQRCNALIVAAAAPSYIYSAKIRSVEMTRTLWLALIGAAIVLSTSAAVVWAGKVCLTCDLL